MVAFNYIYSYIGFRLLRKTSLINKGVKATSVVCTKQTAPVHTFISDDLKTCRIVIT